MKVELSVIITAYNCDKYIQRCIKSVLNQMCESVEIIVVDDGSLDNTALICDKLLEQCSNARIVRKSNGGTVSARKAGLAVAKGDMVCFIDGDDWVDDNYCERMLAPYLQNNNIDMVSSGLFFDYSSKPLNNFVLLDGTGEGCYDKKEIDEHILPNFVYDLETGTGSITTSVCCKLIRRELAIQAISKINEKLTIGEDGAFVLSLLMESKCIYFIHQAFYHYEQHVNSQNYKFEMESMEQLLLLKKNMYSIVDPTKKSSKIQEQIDYYIKAYLKDMEKSIFGIDISSQVFCFPNMEIENGSNIIIHGAGKVGKQFVKYAKKSGQYRLVAWTDKKSLEKFRRNDEPCSINEIKSLHYDVVILAAVDEKVRKQMKKELMQYGVPEHKIISNKPISYRI